MRKNEKGFTMAELLIVVAIIAVLTGVGIVVFVQQLEKSRESTDIANARSAYATVMTQYMAAPEKAKDAANAITAEFELKQSTDDWQTELPIRIGEVTYNGESDNPNWVGTPGKGGKCVVSYSAETGIVFNWSGGTASGGNAPAVATNPIDSTFTNLLGAATKARGQTQKYNSHETAPNGRTADLIAKLEGVIDFEAYGAKTWSLYDADCNKIGDEIFYWSTLDVDELEERYHPSFQMGKNNDQYEGSSDFLVPLIGYNAAKQKYNVTAKVMYKYHDKPLNQSYNATQFFSASSASYNYATYDEALAVYNQLVAKLNENGKITTADLTALGLK